MDFFLNSTLKNVFRYLLKHLLEVNTEDKYLKMFLFLFKQQFVDSKVVIDTACPPLIIY